MNTTTAPTIRPASTEDTFLTSADVKCVKVTGVHLRRGEALVNVTDRTTGEVYGTVRTSQWGDYTAEAADGSSVLFGSNSHRRAEAVARLVEHVNSRRFDSVYVRQIGGDHGVPVVYYVEDVLPVAGCYITVVRPYGESHMMLVETVEQTDEGTFVLGLGEGYTLTVTVRPGFPAPVAPVVEQPAAEEPAVTVTLTAEQAEAVLFALQHTLATTKGQDEEWDARTWAAEAVLVTAMRNA